MKLNFETMRKKVRYEMRLKRTCIDWWFVAEFENSFSNFFTGKRKEYISNDSDITPAFFLLSENRGRIERGEKLKYSNLTCEPEADGDLA
ncbi:hypothetical protein P8452_43864 [Trifolium repens]|nr:hypothetical protein P8452_43864 [Trifolium repens]